VTDINGNVVDPSFDQSALSVPNGLTPHTIVIDGLADFDVANECLIVGTDTLLITWDATYLYLGYKPKDLSTGDLFVNIDINQTNNSGATTDSWGRIQFANPFKIEYQIAIEGGPGNMQINHWNGASWTYLQFGQHGGDSYNGWSGNTYTEMKIPWSALGNPTGFAFSVHLTQEDNNTTTRALPPTNPTGSNVTLSQFYRLYPPYASGPMPLMGVRTKNISTGDIATVQNLTIAWQSGAPRLQWSAVLGAHTYEIYRAPSFGGTYDLIGETSSTTFDDLTPPPGLTAIYYIRARGGI
jgi:hypothetical protein